MTPKQAPAARTFAHRLRNALQALLLIAGMMLVLGLSARLLLGERAFVWTAAMVGFVLLLTPRVSPAVVRRLYGAQPLSPQEAPELAPRRFAPVSHRPRRHWNGLWY